MRKNTVKKRISDLYVRLGKAPSWKELETAGIDDDDIFAHWDFLAEALDEVLGDGWRRKVAKKEADDLEGEEEPAPKGMQYSVYVVKLRGAVMEVARFAKKNPAGTKECLYVGQTWHSPEVRFRNHKMGHKACPLVRKYGQKLLIEKTKDGQFKTRDEAIMEEKRYARELRAQGYRVWQN